MTLVSSFLINQEKLAPPVSEMTTLLIHLNSYCMAVSVPPAIRRSCDDCSRTHVIAVLKAHGELATGGCNNSLTV